MENQKSNANEEIDLGQLLKKFGDSLKEGWLGIMRLLALLRRIPIENKFSFLGIMVVSVGLAVAYSFLLKKNYYESTMILSSQYLNKRLVDNGIRKLDALAQEQDKSGLARLFNISDTLAGSIIGFEAKPFVSEEEIVDLELLKEQLKYAQANAQNGSVIDQVLQRIEIENRHSFEITIRTLEPSAIPNLQEAVVGYFRNNEYVKRRIEITRINQEERKKKLMTELEKMDSLKVVIYANYKSMAEQTRTGGSNNVILSDRTVADPVAVINQDLNLYGELQVINQNLYLRSDFEVIDGFTEFSEPASPSLAKMVLLSLLLGIAVAYLDVAVRAFNKYLASIK
jgi:hypothetical protein